MKKGTAVSHPHPQTPELTGAVGGTPLGTMEVTVLSPQPAGWDLAQGSKPCGPEGLPASPSGLKLWGNKRWQMERP